MINLTVSNITRLFKNNAFRITSVIVALLGLFEIFMLYQDSVNDAGPASFDSALFSFAPLGMFALAAVVSLFTGIEFSDGTIRNKLIAGHHRYTVYLSMLITSIVGEIVLIIVWSIAYLVPGMIVMEHINPLSAYLILYGTMFLELAVCTSIFTLITFTLANKAVASVIGIFCALILLMHGAVITSLLQEPEYYGPEVYLNEDGNMEFRNDMEPNPNYIPEGSTKRIVYETMMDIMPGGQSIQIAEQKTAHCPAMCVYDTCWLAMVNAAGILIFRYKDLK